MARWEPQEQVERGRGLRELQEQARQGELELRWLILSIITIAVAKCVMFRAEKVPSERTLGQMPEIIMRPARYAGEYGLRPCLGLVEKSNRKPSIR